MAAAVRACLNLSKESRLSPLAELVRHFASKAQPGFIEPGYDFRRPMFGPHYGITDSPIQSDGLPLYVDWHKVPGIMPKPFDQGSLGICYICGAVYSCSCVNALATYDTTKENVVLSLQHVLDCNTVGLGTEDGGFYSDVLDFAVSNGGILPRSVYPFTGKGRGVCKYREGQGVSIDGWMRVRPNCQLSMRYALAFQPVVVAVKMDNYILVDGLKLKYSLYKKGTMKGSGYKTEANHAMVIYGYV